MFASLQAMLIGYYSSGFSLSPSSTNSNLKLYIFQLPSVTNSFDFPLSLTDSVAHLVSSAAVQFILRALLIFLFELKALLLYLLTHSCVIFVVCSEFEVFVL